MSYVSGPVTPSASTVTSAMIVDGTIVSADLTLDNYVTAKNANGLLAWSIDPSLCGTNLSPTAATIYLAKIPVPFSITIANLIVFLSVSGTGATAISNAQCGIYNSSGTLLGSSTASVMAEAGAQAIDEASAGAKTVPLTAEAGQSLAITGGATTYVYGALHIGVQASTAAQFRGTITSNAGLVNVGVTAGTARSATQTGHATNNLTTIGALTPASATTINQLLFMGVS